MVINHAELRNVVLNMEKSNIVLSVKIIHVNNISALTNTILLSHIDGKNQTFKRRRLLVLNNIILNNKKKPTFFRTYFLTTMTGVKKISFVWQSICWNFQNCKKP